MRKYLWREGQMIEHHDSGKLLAPNIYCDACRRSWFHFHFPTCYACHRTINTKGITISTFVDNVKIEEVPFAPQVFQEGNYAERP